MRQADKRTLIRRVSFDLIGLPPTPQEVADFVTDPAPSAFSRVVDRLLASPHYGERWGRHWMDVIRYADTAGDNADYPIPEVLRYRDYIIKSFNQDKPFDLALKFLQKCTKSLDSARIPDESRETEAWTSLAKVMLTANEFLYLD